MNKFYRIEETSTCYELEVFKDNAPEFNITNLNYTTLNSLVELLTFNGYEDKTIEEE